jgi:ferredoxin
MSRLTVHVDPDLCEASGMCERVAPEIFRVGEDDRSHLLVEEIDPSLRGKVEEAVRRCPRAAIRLREG